MDILFSLDGIDEAAKKFVSFTVNHSCIALHGEMGAGKTTFVTAVCRALGVRGTAASPTFSIINEYTLPNGKPLYHIDLYRLANSREAADAGVEDCLFSGNLCFVEWPEIAPTLFPAGTLHCSLLIIGNNSRMLQIKL